MSDIETSIRIASRDGNGIFCDSVKQTAWESSSPERKAALVILQDCKDRCGLSGVLDGCDEDVLEEMVKTWAKIIRVCRK